jgi:hypothetical protein
MREVFILAGIGIVLAGSVTGMAILAVNVI